MSACGMTDMGLMRPNNEDQFLVASSTRPLWVGQSSVDPSRVHHGASRGLLAVADGMGGHAGGELASALAIQAVEACFVGASRRVDALANDDAGVFAALHEAVASAARSIAAAAKADPDLCEMGTTLTVAYSVDRTLYVAHAGDTRCYLFSAQNLRRLTTDHTVTAELVAAGLIAEHEARRHPLRNMITRPVGAGSASLTADVLSQDLREGDVVLLCSDGLTEVLGDEDLAEVLQSSLDPRAACVALIEASRAAGAPDNVTAVVARFA